MFSCFEISSLSQPCRSSSTTCRSRGRKIFSSTSHLLGLQTVTPTPNVLTLKSTTFGLYGRTSLHLFCHECQKNAQSEAIQLDNVHIFSRTLGRAKPQSITCHSELFHTVSTTKCKLMIFFCPIEFGRFDEPSRGSYPKILIGGYPKPPKLWNLRFLRQNTLGQICFIACNFRN